MGYLGDRYSCDIFVSYSHGDPEGTGDSQLAAWSRWVVDKLEYRLRSYAGPYNGIDIFIDTELQGNERLTDDLEVKAG